MYIESAIKKASIYLKDQSVDIRIRMIFFLEYASLLVCLIGTIGMILLKQPIISIIPNIILFIMSFIGLYLSHVKKKYDMSAFVMILGCANIALPWMYFTAGGNESGMLIWFIFSVVVSCMMSKGKIRVFMVPFTIIEDIICICVGHFFPHTVTPLVGEDVVFYDVLQSYAVVCAFLAVMLMIYINIYDNQRKQLEEQKTELHNILQTDALTGIFNRHAYYDEVEKYKNNIQTDDLVIVSLDLNELKKVNDLYGHSAGDEYICASANVICQTLGKYGNVFRTGGDEFMAVLHCSSEEAECFEDRLNENISASGSSQAEFISISMGIFCFKENPGISFEEAEKLADKRMYENKASYYIRTGNDRRK